MNIYKIKALQEYQDVEQSQREFMKWSEVKYGEDAPGRIEFAEDEPIQGWIAKAIIAASVVVTILAIIGAVSFGRWMGGAW